MVMEHIGCDIEKMVKKVWYFDSFGNVKPPKEFFEYLEVPQIYYNYDRYPNFKTFLYGRLCLKFLYSGLPSQNSFSSSESAMSWIAYVYLYWKSIDFRIYIFLPIELSQEKNFVLGLADLYTCNSIITSFMWVNKSLLFLMVVLK